MLMNLNKLLNDIDVKSSVGVVFTIFKAERKNKRNVNFNSFTQ